MHLAHRIRLDPNNVQRTWLNRAAGTARFVWNWGLARWQELYKAGEKCSWMALNTKLNAIKVTAFPWMAEVPWRVANAALEDLGGAFGHFFRRVKAGDKPGYPRFKKKGRALEAFCIEGRALNLDGKRLRVPKLGWVRLAEPMRFPGKLLSARFTQRAGHWYVSLQVEVDESWSRPRCETQAAVGIDSGLVDLAVLSDGSKVLAPRVLRQLEPRLRRISKELSRRQRGGRNWLKTKGRLQRLHERIANIRHDVTHNLTARLVRAFRWIGIEDLAALVWRVGAWPSR